MDTVAHSVTVLQKASAMWALVIAGPREVHAPDQDPGSSYIWLSAILGI